MATIHQLPPPPAGKTGWPWTVETPSQIYAQQTNWPRITIVTPSYNQGAFLEETIRSVLLQNYPRLEYVVVDGNSNDASTSIIQRYAPYLTYSMIEPDRGQSHAINKGLARTNGEWCNWLNSDDRLEPNALFHLASTILQHKQAILACGHCLIIDKESQQLGAKSLESINLQYLLNLNHFPQPATFFHRSCLEQSLIDEELHYAMDFRFYLEIFLKNQSCLMIPYPIAASREYAETKSQSGGQRLKKERMQVANALFRAGLLEHSPYQVLVERIRKRHPRPSLLDRVQSFFQ